MLVVLEEVAAAAAATGVAISGALALAYRAVKVRPEDRR